MSLDSGHCNGSSLPTDDSQRVQKQILGSVGSSSKRTLFQDQRTKASQENTTSGDESDLGPMSPLAFTDQSPSSVSCSSRASSISSSPGRQFVSPLATPDELSDHSPVSRISWDRLMPGSGKRYRHDTSPFSALRRVSRAARLSTKRKIFPDSPRSLPSTPISPCTPKKYTLTLTPNSADIVPETPQKSFEIDIQDDLQIETPDKKDSPEHRLITPLGSVTKSAPLPKLHRRKSFGHLETGEIYSPERKENSLKRHAHDNLGPAGGTKFLKTDENCSIPKARAALFKEKQNEPALDNFTLSTKSFYSSSEKKQQPVSSGKITNDPVEQTRKRRSLPAHCGNHRRPSKRRKLGEINAGVRHGIKRPKLKRHSDVHKKDTHNSSQESVHNDKENAEKSNTEKEAREKSPKERSVSPVVDPNKRFFKTNRTSNHVATVTVNHKIKLKVADGKIALKQPKSRFSRNAQKPAKLADISFDATDLTVDEPEIEASEEKSKVDSILKVLEDDWADDDYDIMGTLTNCPGNMVSPVKSAKMVQDVLMSPASVLSSMTSTMNIKDAPAPMDNSPDEDIENNENTSEESKNAGKKYYPLFAKGYSMSNALEPIDSVKGVSDEKKNTKWQMSAKITGANDQYQLDVGQKRFGATQCPECQVVYQMGEPEDENAHLNYHNSVKILKFPGWKKERVIYEDPITSSRIILVESNDPKPCWKKVSEILAVVDRDLGLADMSLTESQNKKVYLYIREKKVLGVLVAEAIQSAHRMIPELIELDCCTAESSPAKCGINVVWTAMSNRRQGIATKLVDTLRAKYFYGYIMSLDDIAFSIPTPSGKKFAEKYTKTKNFKVYN